ncbi:LysE family translocator [Pontibacillus yanchengensis]|uniref:Homoserine transporter n=1 Tax=Pontibacillus yanchengensis Y32 TaxID=1385514 RepID=A0A0A2TG76_9BACI|nr:LysE family translocator [Pontibacillus yanchengensis]KGP73428.1 homoserine transporter [Pontibacillus yanchengensis Y32]
MFISLFSLSIYLLHSQSMDLYEMITNVKWMALIPASFLMASVPGANQILSLRNGLRRGTKTAIIAVTGRFTAFAIMVIGVSLGLGAILQASTFLFNSIKWIGVVYLGWLGLKTILSSSSAYKDEDDINGEDTFKDDSQTPWDFAKQEFIVAAANPKALLLFTVFLPQFITSNTASVGGQILIVGAVYIVIEFCCATVYAFIGGQLKGIGLSARVKRNLDRITGGIMISLAAWLSTQSSK